MDHSSIAIYCPNIACKTPNLEHEHFCKQCRTPLPKRYLWIAGWNSSDASVGHIFADRYWLKSSAIVLDTKPGLPPETPQEVSETIESYLRLFPYNLYVPQPYGVLHEGEQSWLLLEQAPIQSDGTGLLPTLLSQWSTTPPLRQLNWLWQMAQLWLPFQREGVTATLLNPDQIRVEGSLPRLLELQFDQNSIPPNLQELGHFWSQLLPAQSAIAPFLETLCQQLRQGEITSIETVIQHLDYSIQTYSKNQTTQIQLFCLSDRGPSRKKNEDSCYPVSGTLNNFRLESDSATDFPLIIVCDGIGGHEGGDVASQMAIAAVVQQVQNFLSAPTKLPPGDVKLALAEAIRIANDVISQRNDQEQRQERQRMGTTLVMAMPLAHEIYLAHIGDSRAYWITQETCRQITVDDDFASRETRLGYIFYREALQSPVAGSLVQALGMGSSTYLHPSTQRLILDDDCVFLLCSDGLSDFDRVETFWEAAILPVLQGESNVQVAGQRLVELANSWNGHDNVTVGLIHYRIRPRSQSPNEDEAITFIPDFGEAQTQRMEEEITEIPPQPVASSKAQAPPAIPQASSNNGSWLIGLLTLLGLSGVLLLLLNFRDRLFREQPILPSPSPGLQDPGSPTSTNAPEITPTTNAFDVESLLQINTSTNQPGVEKGDLLLELLPQPGSGSPTQPLPDRSIPIPSGTILKVIRRQETTARQYWLQVRICSLPTFPPTSPTNPGTQQVGNTGWIAETELVKYATLISGTTSNSKLECGPTDLPSP